MFDNIDKKIVKHWKNLTLLKKALIGQTLRFVCEINWVITSVFKMIDSIAKTRV